MALFRSKGMAGDDANAWDCACAHSYIYEYTNEYQQVLKKNRAPTTAKISYAMENLRVVTFNFMDWPKIV